MTDTHLPTETLGGFCPWHPERGFRLHLFCRHADTALFAMHGEGLVLGWWVLPVTIAITAKEMPDA